jgi:ATP-binding cassette subfamily B protein
MRQMLINVSRFIEFDLKNEIYRKYQSLSFDFYKNNRTGDLMNRISEDVSKVRMYIGPAIMYTINTISLFTIVITYMISVAPKLTMYTLIPLPILSLIIYKISIVINLKSKIVQEYLSKLTTYTQESFSGVKIIKTYTVEKNINKELNKLANKSKDKNMSLVKIQAWFFPLMILLIGISNILVVFIGGRQFMNNEIELGVLAEFIIYVNMLTWPVATVGWVTSIVQQAEASQKRINEFLNTKSSITISDENNITIEGKIEFKNIEFTYPETKIKACKNISFSLKKGDSLAIMGDIGSGKTTILELLCRIYDPSKGEILIDNLNIKKINIKELRNSIGYVPQSTFLFSETIEKNIKFGKENVNKNELENAAVNACLSEDIKLFKD